MLIIGAIIIVGIILAMVKSGKKADEIETDIRTKETKRNV